MVEKQCQVATCTFLPLNLVERLATELDALYGHFSYCLPLSQSHGFESSQRRKGGNRIGSSGAIT